MFRHAIATSSAAVLSLSALTANAQDSTPPAPGPTDSPTVVPANPPTTPPPPPPSAALEKQYPAVGGHLGMAIPIATLGGRRNVAIGEDFVTVGLTPGITVHLDEKWAIDFEFIAFNELKNTPDRTTFVVDPGIIRKFDGFVAGLRVATQVGAPTNSGVVPIIVVPFKIGKRAVYFVEGDLPLFIRDAGDKALFSATFLFQTGVGF
jgi:hypothetical protein